MDDALKRKMAQGFGTHLCLTCNGLKKALRSDRCRSCAQENRYKRPEERKKTGEMAKKVMKRPGASKKQAEIFKKYWAQPGMSEKHREISKKYWETPGTRKKQSELIKKQYVTGARKRIAGSDHRCWRGGVHTPYAPDFNDDLRIIVRKRDDYLCQNPECYLPENGRFHAVHHIDHDKNNSNPSNLITICCSCHNKVTHGDHEYWTEYYRNLQEMRGICRG
jgi:5-methylcytosine-specific restriction endonuclease McrA